MKLAIIGGGAAGFFCAANLSDLGTRIQMTIFEAGRATLSKVRISGGGRCNVTHHGLSPLDMAACYPRGKHELIGPLHRFGPEDTAAWFERHGVPLKTEADGRMFPVSNQSSTVIDCLVRLTAAAGTRVRSETAVTAIKQSSAGGFDVTFLLEGQTATERFDLVLLATGGTPNGHSLARELGHSISPPVPSLFTFKISDPRIEGLAGISVPAAELGLIVGGKTIMKERGPLLITHWGLSGPVVLKMSSWAARELNRCHYELELSVNFVARPPASGYGSDQAVTGHDEESLRAHLRSQVQSRPGQRIGSGLQLDLPRRLADSLVQHAGIPSDTRWSGLSKAQLNRLIDALLRSRFGIQGKSTFKEEFVTCGGVALQEVDFKTMQSKVNPGLYFAGEVLDIDGLTGGFNFQNAWTGAYLAAQAISAAVSEG